MSRTLFIHGLMGSSQGYKATLLRGLFPDLLIPDFPGDFAERMAKLAEIIGETGGWTLIGSSMGGLMAAVFACQHPGQVERLVLLAPALPFLDLEEHPLPRTGIPVVIYHGWNDDVVPADRTQDVAEQLFDTLTFHLVEDGHDLTKTVQEIDWPALLEA